MNVFSWLTCLNVGIGVWYLVSLKRETMLLFMGGNMLASISFVLALGLVVMVIIAGLRKKLMVTVIATILLVYVMSFIRAWVRSSYLAEHFKLSELKVVAEYSPFIFFLVTLVVGIGCVIWMLQLTVSTVKDHG